MSMRSMRMMRVMRVMRMMRMVTVRNVVVVTEVAVNKTRTAGWIVATGTEILSTIGNIDRTSTTKLRLSIER